MGSPQQFKKSLEKFGNNQYKVLSAMQRRGAFLIMGDLVAGSPVDTGRFQSSWFVGVKVPNRSIAPERQNDSGAAAESKARIGELNPTNVTGKDPIYISNNLPYAVRLAAGSSDQAANGWVDQALVRAKLELDIVQLEVKVT